MLESQSTNKDAPDAKSLSKYGSREDKMSLCAGISSSPITMVKSDEVCDRNNFSKSATSVDKGVGTGRGELSCGCAQQGAAHLPISGTFFKRYFTVTVTVPDTQTLSNTQIGNHSRERKSDDDTSCFRISFILRPRNSISTSINRI